jgi:hypothetical protein
MVSHIADSTRQILTTIDGFLEENQWTCRRVDGCWMP